LKSACKVQKKYEKHIIKREGRTIYMANSAEEAEAYFWQEKKIKYVWTKLREPVEIKKGVTLGDVYSMVLSWPELQALAGLWWPNYRVTTPLEEPDMDRFTLSRQGIIDRNDRLSVVNETEVEPALALSDMPLEVNDSFIVKKWVVNKKNPDITTKQILEGKYPFTLLDLLSGLFHNIDFYGPTTFTRSGLVDEKGKPVDDPLPFLLSDCKLKRVSLGDLFTWVEQHEALKKFISMYSWCSDIDGFHKAAKKRAKRDSDLTHLECYKTLGGWGDSAELCCGFHGIGKPICEGMKESCYGVELSPMGTLAHLPLRLDTTVQVETKEGMIECNHPFTLLEILDSVYWEISYFGGEQQIQDLCSKRFIT
jgi:hypothetical protein